MVWRILTFLVATSLAVFGPAGVLLASEDGRAETAVLARNEDEDSGLVTAPGDDDGGDDDDDSGGFTSGVHSNDRTNSRVTRVSRDSDRSRGDLTRDRTKDGPGGPTRDRTRQSTNDGSRHDTR
jgi:hypothetical protein